MGRLTDVPWGPAGGMAFTFWPGELIVFLCLKGLPAGGPGPGHQLGRTGLGAGRVCGEWRGEGPSSSLGLGRRRGSHTPLLPFLGH